MDQLTAGVVTREDGLVLSDAIRVGLYDAAQEGGVHIGEIVRVAIAGCRNARVDTSGIAVPEIHVHSWHGHAGAGVDKLDVEIERHAFLAVGDVAPDQLTVDVIRALGDLRLQDAGCVIREEQGLVVAVRDARSGCVRDIVRCEVAADERAAQASLDLRFVNDFMAASKSGLGDAAAFELRGTLADRLGCPLHESRTLRRLFADVMSWVRPDDGQCEKTVGQDGHDRCHRGARVRCVDVGKSTRRCRYGCKGCRRMLSAFHECC